jgi:hypothetical protein
MTATTSTPRAGVRRVKAGWRAFRVWAKKRPFVGGVLVVISGIELFFSGQLDLGRIQIQFGIEGLQATVIPVAMIVLGVLAILMPQHHVFYGVIALALAVYAVIGVNLGGFMIGTLLGVVGGILVVAYLARSAPSTKAAAEAAAEVEAEA